MAKNVHKVTKRQWAKWNKAQQAMFNRLYAELKHSELLTNRAIQSDEWRVIRWNAAFLAACEAGDMEIRS